MTLRLLLVFLFYLAAELVSPVAATPVELLDGEAEESVQHAGQRRVARIPIARTGPVAAEVVAHAPSAAPRSAPAASHARANPVRKIPAPSRSDAPPAPQDH